MRGSYTDQRKQGGLTDRGSVRKLRARNGSSACLWKGVVFAAGRHLSGFFIPRARYVAATDMRCAGIGDPDLSGLEWGSRRVCASFAAQLRTARPSATCLSARARQNGARDECRRAANCGTADPRVCNTPLGRCQGGGRRRRERTGAGRKEL